MTTIFLSSESADQTCADRLRQGLEAAGYTAWRAPDFPTPREQSYPYLIENAILGSAALVVLWSQQAAASVWVKRHILIAQRFFKPLVPVQLDETALPSMLLVESLAAQEPCEDLAAQIVPKLPAPHNQDALLTLGEQAAHRFGHVRKAAIEQAASLLQHEQPEERRQAVLAILEYLVRNDLMPGVREKAQAVLTAATATPSPLPQEARHLFRVRCKHGHISTFDRRKVCSQRKEIMRGLDELLLSCATCGVEMTVAVDCEGY